MWKNTLKLTRERDTAVEKLYGELTRRPEPPTSVDCSIPCGQLDPFATYSPQKGLLRDVRLPNIYGRGGEKYTHPT
jgi:hypothetical protein